jgi:hypothetical protein
MNRADLQALANLHLRHGEALLNAQLFAGAYYISGYAVECGLKAAVAKLFRYTADFEFPGSEKRGAVTTCHSLLRLLDSRWTGPMNWMRTVF